MLTKNSGLGRWVYGVAYTRVYPCYVPYSCLDGIGKRKEKTNKCKGSRRSKYNEEKW